MFKSYKHIDAFALEEKLREESLLPRGISSFDFVSDFLGLDDYSNDVSYRIYIPNEYDPNTSSGIAYDYIKSLIPDEVIYADVCW